MNNSTTLSWLAFPQNKPEDSDSHQESIVAIKNPHRINKSGYFSSIPAYQLNLASWHLGHWHLSNFQWNGQHLSNHAEVVYFLALPPLPT